MPPNRPTSLPSAGGSILLQPEQGFLLGGFHWKGETERQDSKVARESRHDGRTTRKKNNPANLHKTRNTKSKLLHQIRPWLVTRQNKLRSALSAAITFTTGNKNFSGHILPVQNTTPHRRPHRIPEPDRRPRPPARRRQKIEEGHILKPAL